MLEIILDFKKNIGKYIFLVFEKIILLLFLVILLSDILKIHDGLERLKGIDQNNIYINHDMTSDEKIDQLFSNEKESIIKCKELYHFISNNFKKYSFYSYSTDLVVNDNEILLTSTDKYFFDIYSIKVENGRNFNLSDYKNTNTIIPVIIGYNVSNKYKLNDNFRIIDPNTNLKKEFKVIGVLNKNSNYTNFDVIGQKNSLDDMIIKIIDEKDLNSLATL
ncbi:MAG: ABC transporter permease, partial [Bacilli bacterium]|nr:ABC transporter permease [Bacilli bacterium]